MSNIVDFSDFKKQKDERYSKAINYVKDYLEEMIKNDPDEQKQYLAEALKAMIEGEMERTDATKADSWILIVGSIAYAYFMFCSDNNAEETDVYFHEEIISKIHEARNMFIVEKGEE